MTRKISIKGYKLKDGRLVPCYKHLPVNIQLQKRVFSHTPKLGVVRQFGVS